MNNPLFDGLYKKLVKQRDDMNQSFREMADDVDAKTAQTTEPDHNRAADLAKIAEWHLKCDRFDETRKLFEGAYRLTLDDETLSKTYRDKADGVARR